MPPSPQPTTDPRPHRLAWCIALGLFIPIIGTLAVIAFWPLPSPKPYRERALALMQGDHTTLDLERGKQAVLDLESIRADMDAIQGEVIAAFTATHGTPPTDTNGNPGKWIASPQLLAGPDYAKRATPTEIELARKSLQLYEERGIFDRIEAFADTPILWADLDPTTSILHDGPLLNTRSLLRGITRELCARLKTAAERNDAEVARRSSRAALRIANLQGNGSANLDAIFAIALRALALNEAIEIALNPDIESDVIRAMLDEFNSAKPLRTMIAAFAIERPYVIESWLVEAGHFTALERLDMFVTQTPGPREWIAALNHAHDAIDAVAANPDPRAGIDLSTVPVYKFPFAFGDLDLHQHCIALHRLSRNHISLQTQYNATRLLLAITLYQREHHNTPPRTLSDLVPDYLPSLPQDPYAPDHQFRYRILPPLEANQRQTRFILYSVGYDAIDNQGAPPIGARDSLEPLHSDKHPNTDAIFHPRLTRPQQP